MTNDEKSRAYQAGFKRGVGYVFDNINIFTKGEKSSEHQMHAFHGECCAQQHVAREEIEMRNMKFGRRFLRNCLDSPDIRDILYRNFVVEEGEPNTTYAFVEQKFGKFCRRIANELDPLPKIEEKEN